MNVLITGANSGFGLLSAETFAKAGHTVFAGYRNPDRLSGLTALKASGLPIEPVRLDVTSPPTIEAAIVRATRDGPIDVLVNNAGYELIGAVDEVSEENAQRQFDTNVMGLLRMVRAVSPAMRARRAGVIVNVSSMVGWMSVPYAGLYSASKHAIEALSEALWFELKPFGVRVVVIEPGGYQTNFSDNLVIDDAFTETSQHWGPGQRFRTATLAFVGAASAAQKPQEVADAILEAATTSEPRLRWLVGNDARALVPLYRSHEFEAFSKMMMESLGLADWTVDWPTLNSALL